MSILERPALPPPPAAETPSGDRLRVITAGSVGNIDARLGASGFDVVAVAETEDALIDAVAADEPDAIVVEADLCDSLEHVRGMAPDAVLIAVGDHTPAGALGRIEEGVSGTVMAGLLHALVAEGVGAAAVWGLVPAFGSQGTLRVPQHMIGSLLTTKADLVRAWFASALRDPAELVTATSTVAVTVAAVTVSAGLVLTLGALRTHERPERVPSSPAPAVQSAVQHPVVFASPMTPTPAYGRSWSDGEPSEPGGPNGGESRDHARHMGKDAGGGHGQDGLDHGQDSVDHRQDGLDHGQDGLDHGQDGLDHGQDGLDQDGLDQGQDGLDHGQDGLDHGQDGLDHGQDGLDHSPGEKSDLDP